MIIYSYQKIANQGFAKDTQFSLKDILKTSWMRSALILALVATVAGIVLFWLFKSFDFSDSQFFVNIQEFFLTYGLFGIFIGTIIAGTLIPLGSPALIAAAALFGVNPIALIIVATTGFTIGMIINYVLAYQLGRPYIEKKMSAKDLQEMTSIWHKWGWIIYIIFGLIPVLPVELLSFICGFLKTRLFTFIILSFVPRLFVFTLLVYFGQSAGIWLGFS